MGMKKTPEAIASALRETGLIDSGGVPIALGPQRFAAYVRVRNEARMEAHRLIFAERKSRLHALLIKHAPATGGANSRLQGDGPMLACGSFDKIRQEEKTFVQHHI